MADTTDLATTDHAGGAVKVPEPTAWFWVVKIVTTALGEAVSDYLVNRYDPKIVVVFGFVAFAAALALQLRAPRYVPWIYWLAALAVATFGTMAADVVHVGLGIPYLLSAIGCAVALVVVFRWWWVSEGTLSIHSVDTRRRELFYWAAALVTFALGTATGDLTAITFHLGYLASGVLFAVVFLIPGLGYWRFGLDGIVAYWVAYVVTRPLGASFADWAGKPISARGLGWGDGIVSAGLFAALVLLVAWPTIAPPSTTSTSRSTSKSG